MAGAHDDDITFGVLFYGYITTVEEEENQPERRTRRAAVTASETVLGATMADRSQQTAIWPFF